MTEAKRKGKIRVNHDNQEKEIQEKETTEGDIQGRETKDQTEMGVQEKETTNDQTEEGIREKGIMKV